MKYKVGDKVRIKSIDWYNDNNSKRGNISFPYEVEIVFTSEMSSLCGQIVTISKIGYTQGIGFYRIREDCGIHMWTDEMIEGLVEEETKPKYEDEVSGEYYSTPKYLVRPSGYQFVDENGNVINATKIVLEKKKKEYPKTYEECYQITGLSKTSDIYGYKNGLLFEFQKLLIARDAYWEIAGEEMGLGKPWEPDWTIESSKYIILLKETKIEKHVTCKYARVFAFPTAEMRDAFYENFDKDLEFCKELL